MGSKLPKYTPPSVYTPFFRRFTDERALELADTQALYRAVTGEFNASVWSAPDIIDKVNGVVAEQVGEFVTLPPAAICEAIDRCQIALLSCETTLFKTPVIVDWSLSLKEQVDLRRFLRSQEHFLAHQDQVAGLLVTALGNIFAGLISALPDVTCEEGPFQVPLYTFLDVNDVVDRIIGTLSKIELADSGLFVALNDRLYRNICAASKLMPYEEHKRPFVTAADSELPPVELIETYLAGTPFLELFSTPLPFAIPHTARFEHTHIVAGIGHGKTQLMQTMMLADFDDPAQPAVVAIDSQGDMIRTLSRLERFNPAHDERLIILDPADTEWPLKLNLFDADRGQLAQLPRGQRETILAGIIEMYKYIFGALFGAELTAKQAVVFDFLAQLMLAIPGANIHTLRQLLVDPAPYFPFIERLPPTARGFLNEQLFAPKEKEYVQTRKQIVRRLYSILANPTFERMFAHPTNALDMGRVLDEGKVVLVSTAKDVLKADASATFGRFIIALIMQAALARAARDRSERRAAFVYVDEASEYFDGNINTLLIQARKYNLGLALAHQHLDQLGDRELRASVIGSPAVRYAGGLADKDARALAADMRTTGDFLMATRKHNHETEFACFVRNHTPSAIKLTLPLLLAEREPKMSVADFANLKARVRAEVAAPIAEVDALIAAAPSGAPMVHHEATTFSDDY